MKKRGLLTSFRLTELQQIKLEQMARQLNISRNRMIGLLVESAAIEQLPVVSIQLRQKETPEGSDLGCRSEHDQL